VRESNYNIYIPLTGSEDHLLIHGYSGAVDVVHAEVTEFLQNYQDKKSRRSNRITDPLVESLLKRGYLTERTFEEEKEYVRKLGRVLFDWQKKGTGFLLMPTYDCNLRCPYCYEKQLRRKGSEWMQKTMDRSTVDSAYEAMTLIQQSQNSQENAAKRITLYGGEPFLRQNLDIVTYIVEKGGGLGYAFSAITNGVELDNFQDLLGKGPGKVNWIQITLDGPPDIHDVRRRRADGSPTFADTASNIDEALKRGVTVYLRSNVDKSNLNRLPELSCIYQERGWVKSPNFIAYSNVVEMKPEEAGCENLLTCGQLMTAAQENKQSHPQMESIPTARNMQRRFILLLKGDGYPHFSPAFCGSHLGMYILDPYGDIYACWESVGEPIGRIGRYLPDLEMDGPMFELWRERAVIDFPECVSCKFVFLCGGGCATRAYTATQSLKSSICMDFPEAFCAAVPEAYAEYRKNKGAKG